MVSGKHWIDIELPLHADLGLLTPEQNQFCWPLLVLGFSFSMKILFFLHFGLSRHHLGSICHISFPPHLWLCCYYCKCFSLSSSIFSVRLKSPMIILCSLLSFRIRSISWKNLGQSVFGAYMAQMVMI